MLSVLYLRKRLELMKILDDYTPIKLCVSRYGNTVQKDRAYRGVSIELPIRFWSSTLNWFGLIRQRLRYRLGPDELQPVEHCEAIWFGLTSYHLNDSLRRQLNQHSIIDKTELIDGARRNDGPLYACNPIF
jgi:hypothetical protein